jgi:hypothetical protein
MPNDEANLILPPKYKEHIPHPAMEYAKAHSETHTEIYHRDVLMTLVRVDVPGATRDDLIEALREIAMDLKEGAFSV